MIPLYGFLEGDTLGLVVLASEHDTAATLARKLQSAATLRVERREAVSVWIKGTRMAPTTTVAASGLQALDRFDVREDEGGDAVSFQRVANLRNLWVGGLEGVVVDGTKVLLVRLDDGVRAFEDRCAHKGVELSGGRLSGRTLTCAAHEWCYDAASGRGVAPTHVCLRAFAVRVEGDDVLVDVHAEAAPAERGDAGAPDVDAVGPVLQSGPLASAVVAAILAENDGAHVIDRGAYLRVLRRGRLAVTRAAIEAQTGTPFRLPRDLELLMSSFKGRFRVSEDEASWEVRWRA